MSKSPWRDMEADKKARYAEASRCRQRAMRQLAKMHKEQYRTLCQAEYAKAGLELRPRGMTEEQKKQREISRLKAKLAALESGAA